LEVHGGMVYWDLLVAFTRANLLGYGGGPSVIPLIRAEVVGTYKWLSDGEFADALAIGNALPGPIPTKMSAFIGYKVAGLPGAAVGLVGTALPTAILMIVLSALLMRYSDAPVVKGMIKGAKPVVWVLFSLFVIEFLPFVRPDKVGWMPAVMAVVAFVALYGFRVHAAIVISAGLVLGGIFLRQ
jgi:chromate transporter